MRRLHLLSIMLMLALTMAAQGNRQPEKFSPEKFDADLKAFITNEAKLTTQEADRFFPVYKEMMTKMRGLFEKQRNLGTNTPNDEASCLKAIKERDDTDLELKRIQKAYHEKFLKLIPASKVYAIIQAEDRFHRRMIKSWGNGRQQKQWNPQQQPQQGQRRWPQHQQHHQQGTNK